MLRHARPLAVSIAALAAACGASDVEEGALVVGIQSDDLSAFARSVHVVVIRDGAVVHDESVPLPSAVLPKELPIRGPVGARIDVSAEALPVAGAPLITRRASAHLAAQGNKLLRVQLETRCVVFSAGGAASAVTCAAPLTCIGGACAPSAIEDDALEDYEATWPLTPPDRCRPAKHGAPEVILGTGQTDYADLAEGQTLSLERGPQGGHHIWIAARMRNLRQIGSTTAISSAIEGDPAPVPPVAFAFTFEKDEGSYCKIWGLRYQVDAGASDLRTAYKRFLGKRLAVTVVVRDATGAMATATRTVQLSEMLLCPDGTSACDVP